MAVDEGEGVRLRLEFLGDDILGEPQKSQGLSKSWILLKPHFTTISDLSDHLLRVFQLNHSCPHGLLLSMDGFALPSFESTYILKDGDVISVKKKGVLLSISGNGDNGLAETRNHVEKQLPDTRALVLANEDLVEGNEDYETEEAEELNLGEPPENLCGYATSKKRKAPEDLHGSKKKKVRIQVSEGIANSGETERVGHSNQHRALARKKHADPKNQSKVAENSVAGSGEKDDNIKSKGNASKNDQHRGSSKKIDNEDNVPAVSKGPSRSSRRQYAKRRWLRELAKIQKADIVSKSEGQKSKKRGWTKTEREEATGQPKGLLYWKPLPGKEMKIMTEHQQGDQDNNGYGQPNQFTERTKKETLKKTRPGKFHLETSGEGQSEQLCQLEVETFMKKGIAKRRKGQKWGTMKLSCRDNRNSVHMEEHYGSVVEDIFGNKLAVSICGDKKESLGTTQENGETSRNAEVRTPSRATVQKPRVDPWEEFSETLSSRKTQLWLCRVLT